MTDTAEFSQDRELLKGVLSRMSASVSGREVGDLVPDLRTVDSFVSPDVPVAPGEEDPDHPVDENGAPVAEAVARNQKRAGSSSYAWGGHQNGRIPTKEMKAIGQGSHKLEASAADAWIAMREAAKRDGVSLSLTDSYRSYDAQVSVRQRKGHLVATATPGTSVHGWGRAVDANVNDPKTFKWLNENGPRFGWIWPAWAQRKGKSFESWHREFVGVPS